MATQTTPKRTGKAAGSTDASPTRTRRLEWVPLDRITVQDGFNPRRGNIADSEGFGELVDSVKLHGILQPVLLREHVGEDYFTVVAGHRRLAAAHGAGLVAVPALIGEHSTDPRAAAAAALVENLQREDLSPVDQALAITALMDENGLTQVQVAKLMGKSERWLRERVRILKLSPKIQDAIGVGRLSVTAVRELERIGEIAPRAADAIADVLIAGTISTAEFLEDPAQAMYEAASSARGDDTPDDVEDGLGLVDLNAGSFDIRNAPLAAVMREDYLIRLKAAQKIHPNRPIGPFVSLPDDVVERARTAGLLLEFEIPSGNGRTWTHRYVAADEGFWTGLLGEAVGAFETEAAAAKEAADRAPKPKPGDDPITAGHERRQAHEREQQAIDAAAQPFAAQMNAALGRRLRGMTAVSLDGISAQLLVELAAGAEHLPTVIECGLALCDPSYAEPRAGQQAWIDRVVGEQDPQAAAAFIIGAWVAYYYADRRGEPARRAPHPIRRGDENDSKIALVREAARFLKLLPGTRPEDYLQAVSEHARATLRHGREGNRRRILLELSEVTGRAGADYSTIHTATGTYRYEAAAKAQAASQLYSSGPGSAFDVALQDLVDAGDVERREAEPSDDAKIRTKLKITKQGKARLDAPALEAPLFPSIDPDEPAPTDEEA